MFAVIGPAPTPIGVPGSGGAAVPHAGGGDPPLELLPLVLELELLLELLLEVLPVPINPVVLELLPVPIKPVVLELLELLLLELLLELLLLELELLLELLEVAVPLTPVVLVLLLLVELPEVVVALECELLPFPVDPPANMAIAIASWDGKLARSTCPGTSIGVFTSARTNSLVPL